MKPTILKQSFKQMRATNRLTPLAIAGSNIGQGLGWLGFWLMLGMICTINSTGN